MHVTTNVHADKGQPMKATADLHYTEGQPIDNAFVTLNVGTVSFFVRERVQIEGLRAALAQADDLLAQIEAARAVQDKIERDRAEADAGKAV
jgi:hypothetical protein